MPPATVSKSPFSGLQRFRAACAAVLVLVLAGCARTEESVASTRPREVCFGSLEACEGDAAAFAPLVDSERLSGLLREGGTAAGEALTLAYDLPDAPAYCLEGSANRQRMRLRSGVVSSHDGMLNVVGDDLVRNASGRVLVEVTLGSHRGLFGKEIVRGSASAIAGFLEGRLLGPLLLVGWFTLATVQQVLARRHRAQRVGSMSLALLTASTALRILTFQNDWSTIWSGSGALRRTLELVTVPMCGFGATVFYRWLVGESLRSRAFTSWAFAAMSSGAFAVASIRIPSWRPHAVPFVMCVSVWCLVITAYAIARGWRRIDEGERKLVLAGVGALSLGAVGDIVITRFDLAFVFGIGCTPFGLVVETLCQALILARRNDLAQ